MSEAYDLYQLGRARLREGLAAQATVPLEKARRLEPEKASIREALGIAYFRLSRWTEAEDAWIRAGRDTAEESYGDFQLVVDAIADGLLALRDTYARTLDEDAATAYRDTFAVGVGRRFRHYASVVADLEP